VRDLKKNKRKEKTVPVRFPQKQIEKKTELNHAPLQLVPLGSRYPWGLNLLSLDTAAGKEVTKEGRDVSGLGQSNENEVWVVRLGGALRAGATGAEGCA
jgi:hypothetical protein